MLEESYYLRTYIYADIVYVACLFTQDSIYYISNNQGKKNRKIFEYGIIDNITKVHSGGTIYYTQKKDSIFIYKNASIKNDNLYQDFSPLYYSNYVNGKLDQLTYGDSIIYKKKGSKMVVDLKKLKGYYMDWDTGKQTYYP